MKVPSKIYLFKAFRLVESGTESLLHEIVQRTLWLTLCNHSPVFDKLLLVLRVLIKYQKAAKNQGILISEPTTFHEKANIWCVSVNENRFVLVIPSCFIQKRDENPEYFSSFYLYLLLSGLECETGLANAGLETWFWQHSPLGEWLW